MILPRNVLLQISVVTGCNLTFACLQTGAFEDTPDVQHTYIYNRRVRNIPY
jgi:hypothetical protein